MNDELTLTDHLEWFLNQAVASAIQGRPDVDLFTNDAYAILDQLRSLGV